MINNCKTFLDPEQIGAKRRKKVPHFGDYSDQGGSGLGGAGGGGGGGGGGVGGLGGGMGLNLDIWNQLFSFMPPGPSGSGGMANQSQGQAPPQGNFRLCFLFLYLIIRTKA